MDFDSRQLVQMLRALEQQIFATPEHAKAVRLALDGEDRAELLCSLVDAERILSKIAALGQRIEHLVASDGLGAVSSLSELVFRALRMVLFSELSALERTMCDPNTGDRARTLFSGKFKTIRDVKSYAHKALEPTMQRWLRERETLPGNHTTCRTLLRAAELAMRALAGSLDLLIFVDNGMKCDVPAVATTCSCIQAALNIRIDVPTGVLPRNVMRLRKLMVSARAMADVGALP